MKNNKSIFANQLATTIGKKAVDIQDDGNYYNRNHREDLLITFAELCVPGGTNLSKSNKINYADFKQFDKIAELIEDEINKFGYPKDLARSDVLDLVRDKLENVGIMANSDEGLEFIDFLKGRWKC